MDTDRGGVRAALNSGDEISVKGHVAVGHARSVECETRMAMAIEKDQAAGGMGTFREQMHSFTSGQLPGGNAAGFAGPSSHADRRFTQEVDGSFGHHDFHDGFAVAGTGDPAGFGIGVTATADQRGIADASRKFAASAAGGSRCKQISFPIDGHGSYGSLYVTAMMLGRVLNRKSTRLNSSHGYISYAVFCLKKKKYLNSGTQRATAKSAVTRPNFKPELFRRQGWHAPTAAIARSGSALIVVCSPRQQHDTRQ